MWQYHSEPYEYHSIPPPLGIKVIALYLNPIGIENQNNVNNLHMFPDFAPRILNTSLQIWFASV